MGKEVAASHETCVGVRHKNGDVGQCVTVGFSKPQPSADIGMCRLVEKNGAIQRIYRHEYMSAGGEEK